MTQSSSKIKIGYFDIQRFSNVSHKVTIKEQLRYFSEFFDMIPLVYRRRGTDLSQWFNDVKCQGIRFVFFNDVFIFFDFFTYRYTADLDIGFILFPFIINPWLDRWVSIASLVSNKDVLLSFSHYVGNRMDRIAPLLTRVDFPVPIDGEMIRRIPPYTGDSEGMFRIVFCSRLEPYRHLDLLVDAVSRLDNRMKCIIHIISDRPDYSEYYQSIVDLIYRCGLTASVRWWGDLADQTDLKMALFKHANVLVHLSTFEGETFGRVVIEAMACGLPVITTRWQALDELVKEGENGYLISVKNNKVNRSELISALERFMNDPDTGRKIGETNRNESLRYNYRHVFLTLVEKLKQLDNQSIIFSNPLTLPWSISSKI